MDERDIEEALETLNEDEAACLYWKSFENIDNKEIPPKVNETRERKIKSEWVAKKIQSGYAKLGIEKELHGTVKERIFRTTFGEKIRRMYDAGFWKKYRKGRKRIRELFFVTDIRKPVPLISSGSEIITTGSEPIAEEINNSGLTVMYQPRPERIIKPRWNRIIFVVLFIFATGVFLGGLLIYTILEKPAATEVAQVVNTVNPTDTVDPNVATVVALTLQPKNTVVPAAIPVVDLPTATLPPAATATRLPTPSSTPEVAPGTILFQDNFDSGTPEGNGWRIDQGSVGYADGMLRALANAQISIGDTSWKNYEISVNVIGPDCYKSTAKSRLGVRVQNPKEMVQLVYCQGSGEWHVINSLGENRLGDYFKFPPQSPLVIRVQNGKIEIPGVSDISLDIPQHGGITFTLARFSGIDNLVVKALP